MNNKNTYYEIRTATDFVVCQYVDFGTLERQLKTHYSHLTNYKIIKITKEEEIICEVSSNSKAGTHGSSVQQVPADSLPDKAV